MLAIVEDCLGGLRAAQSEVDIAGVLGKFAGSLGFRSAFLIEYSDTARPMLSLDADPTRGDEMPRYLESDPALSQRSVEALPETENIFRLDRERFGDSQGDQTARGLSRELEVSEVTAVPIRHDHRVVGLAGFCGDPVCSAPTEIALTLVAYSAFAQWRTARAALRASSEVSLTPREKQVIKLASDGMTSAEISQQLGMSARTADQHLDNVAEKLGTRNRSHTIAECVRRGLV